MKTIYFATENNGKVATMQRYVNEHKAPFQIAQRPLDLIEPQADTATEVARAKARQAFEQLGAPVVVDDSSFHITALGGFPGPYIKYMLTTIGVAGILAFLAPHEDRSAYFLSTLVYIDAQGNEHVFEDEPYWGTVASGRVNVQNAAAWSELFTVFVPNGTTKVLAELTEKERLALATAGDSYAAFVHWLVHLDDVLTTTA